uniref:T-box domain-containing protein n=1 Tax=Heterorhabditis bacteriophora TaxID=37862 RepID=A0A1I7WXH3_HETBA
MFPTVKVSISKIDPEGLYYVFLDVIPVDNKRYRYIYNKSAWLTAGKAEPAPKNRLYMHPDSPYSGEQLLKQVVSFEKAKLTNNEVDKTGHVDLSHETHRTFVFAETQFMAVTAYQNQLITKLKIEKNPFAKGFRDPSGRSPEYEPFAMHVIVFRDTRSEVPLMLPMYNPAIFQQALFNQYYLKAAAARAIPSLNPALLSHMLLSSLPMLPPAQTEIQLNTSPAKSEGVPI